MTPMSWTFCSLRHFMLFACLLWMSGCASDAPGKNFRVCDVSGCSLRPADAVTTEYRERPSPKSEQFVQLEKLAETEPKAAYDLALRYFRGDGVSRAPYQGLQWMRKAAERGNLQAQKALGGYYLTGLEEMGADPREAEKWLALAAAAGDAESEKLLAEAREAKAAEVEDYRWRQRWRESMRYYWYGGYPYFGRWNGGYWHYY